MLQYVPPGRVLGGRRDAQVVRHQVDDQAEAGVAGGVEHRLQPLGPAAVNVHPARSVVS
jgi:hypothetical protein